MKVKRIIYGLSILAVVAVCSFNVQSSLSVTDGSGYSSLTDLITLNAASAEESGGSCKGSTCDSANGYKYATIVTNGVTYCCGAMATSSGSKSS